MGRLQRLRFGAQSATGFEPSVWSTIFTDTRTVAARSKQSRLITARKTSLPHFGRAE